MLQVRALTAAVCLALGLSVPATAHAPSTRASGTVVTGAVESGGMSAYAVRSGGNSRTAHARRPQTFAEQLSKDSVAPRRGASLAGRIILPDGTPAEGARVAVYAVARDTAARTVVGTATSAFDGRYEVLGLPPGEVLIGAIPNSPVTSPRVETLYPGIDDVQRAGRVTLFEGVATEGIDIWLTPSAQRFSVAGRIFGPDGRELRNLVIEYGGPAGTRQSVWFVSDPGGLFTIEGVPQGTLVLLARAETDDGLLLGVASTDISVGNVEDVRIVLRPPGHVEGRIVFERDAPDATPLRVSLVQTLLELSPLPVEEATVARDGRFQLRHAIGENAFEVKGLPAGWSVSRVLRGGRPIPNNRITVGPGEQVDGIEIVLGRRD